MRCGGGRRPRGAVRLSGIARGLLRGLVDVRRYHLFATALDTLPPLELPPGVTVRPLAVRDLAGLPAFLDAEDLAARLQRGERMIVAELSGAGIVGFNRLAAGPGRDDPHPTPVAVRPGELYADGLVVAPESRGRGIGLALVLANRARARDGGAQTVLNHVEASNVPMLRIEARIGSRVREEVVSVVVARLVRFAVRRPAEGG